VRLDESDYAFQVPARLERGKVGEYVPDWFAAADRAGNTVERYARSGNPITVAASFDILTSR